MIARKQRKAILKICYIYDLADKDYIFIEGISRKI